MQKKSIRLTLLGEVNDVDGNIPIYTRVVTKRMINVGVIL
ncbi:hypothetical protein LCGC14_2042280 [marine sediment metagenome]|uniref:Uncharacterized protein n=1 Tax=marine sediment metagenome TaxID=412755 RepID=A0A0F9HNH5_9ZZZZ